MSDDLKSFLSARVKRKVEKEKEEVRRNEFINGMELSDEQQMVVDNLKNWLMEPYDSEKWCATLCGSAGVGKSVCSIAVVRFLRARRKRFVLAAPTHKAKYILSGYTQCYAHTVHSLFGLRPDMDVEKFDWNDVKFNLKRRLEELKNNNLFGLDDNLGVPPEWSGGAPPRKQGKQMEGLPIGGVIIIDECSMINEPFFRFMKEISVPLNIKFLFIGDRKQLKPVNDKESLCFNNSYTYMQELTKVFRQDGESALMPVLEILRDRKITSFSSAMSERGSIYVVDSMVEFMKPLMPILSEAIKNGNTDAAKVICYRNKIVNTYNNTIRKVLFRKDACEPLLEGEFLVGEENFEFCNRMFYNSSDYIVEGVSERCSISIPYTNISLNCVMLGIRSKFDGWSITGMPYVINEWNDNQDLYEVALKLDGFRDKAAALSRNGERMKSVDVWKKYYAILRCFSCDADLTLDDGRVIKKKSFRHGYAITSYKSQGSSYQSVFVDVADLLTCGGGDEEIRQHEYVSLSRTRKDAYIIQK